MPFTLAHAAAALPLRPLRLVPSALVVGTMAPDFEYFLRFAPQGGFGHTFLGAFLLSLPLALVVLWMFHAIVKRPLVELFPDSIRLRLAPQMGGFRFGGVQRFILIAVSVLAGIATHIGWDSMTHRYTWPVRHWALLRQPVHIWVLGKPPMYKLLQHGSSVIGVLALCVWIGVWYRRTEPRHDSPDKAMHANQRWRIAACIAGVALAAGILRAVSAIGSRGLAHHGETILGEAIVTTVALAWWLLVGYGIVVAIWRPSHLEA